MARLSRLSIPSNTAVLAVVQGFVMRYPIHPCCPGRTLGTQTRYSLQPCDKHKTVSSEAA